MYWYLLPRSLESAVVEAQKMSCLRGDFLTISMYHNGKKIKFIYYDETKKMAHDSQIVKARKMNLSYGWAQLQVSIRHRPTD